MRWLFVRYCSWAGEIFIAHAPSALRVPNKQNGTALVVDARIETKSAGARQDESGEN
jgi:hypothetical protein